MKTENLNDSKVRLKILLALPDGRIHKLKVFGDHYISFREAHPSEICKAAMANVIEAIAKDH